MAFFAVFELGSLICALAYSSKMLIAGRAIAGMGSSGLLNGAFTILAECVPMSKRPSGLLQPSMKLISADSLDSFDWTCHWQ